jgi:hypothetical protein
VFGCMDVELRLELWCLSAMSLCSRSWLGGKGSESRNISVSFLPTGNIPPLDSKKRKDLQLFSSERIIQDIATDSRWEDSDPQKYYKRGWTFQENLFSKRRLIFEHKIVRWECQQRSWHEHLRPSHYGKLDSRWHDQTEQWLHSTIPPINELSSIARTYSQMDLTYPGDAFRAFAGVQSFLNRRFPYGLIFGLPELFFDITLTWHPRGPIKRRITSTSLVSPSHIDMLPSWSWIAWDGAVSFPSDHEFGLNPPEMVGYTQPVAEWYAMKSPSSKVLRQINNKWYEYKSMAQQSDAPLLPGWIQKKYIKPDDLNREFLPRVIPEYCYQYSLDIAEYARGFSWYPIPVMDDLQKFHQQPQTSFLCARTSIAYLYADGKEEHIMKGYYHGEPPRVQLLDSSGVHVGFLRLNHEDELEYFQAVVDDNARRRLELAATCKGYSIITGVGGLAEDCFFVLWIERKNGVAYRKACGVVTVEAWGRKREVELIDLVLG